MKGCIAILIPLVLLGCSSPKKAPTKTLVPKSILTSRQEDSIKQIERGRKQDSLQTVRKNILLKAINEPDLQKVNHEMYRIFWGFAFERGPESGRMVRIEKAGDGRYYITTKWYYEESPIGEGHIYGNLQLFNDTLLREFKRDLYPDNWYDMKALINGSYFWSRPMRDGSMCIDGWGLIIEGVEFNKDSNRMVYHKIIRSCPQSEPILAIYNKLLELSGVYFKNEKGQWEELKPGEYRSGAY